MPRNTEQTIITTKKKTPQIKPWGARFVIDSEPKRIMLRVMRAFFFINVANKLWHLKDFLSLLL